MSYYDSTTGNSGAKYRQDDVDVEASASGGYDLGWTAPGEWTNYTVNVSAAGNYDLNVMVASPYSGKSLRIDMNGTTKATVDIPNTGGYQAYQTVTVKSIALNAGKQVMRIFDVTDGFNLDYVEFVKAVPSTPTPAPTATPVPTPTATPNSTGGLPTPPGALGLAPTSYNAGHLNLWIRSSPGDFNNYDSVTFLPADYGSDPAKKYPLVISLHGRGGSVLTWDHSAPGGNQEGFIKQVWEGNPLQKSFPAIVVAPHNFAPNTGGDAWWNEDWVMRLIVDSAKYYNVDLNRIVITGLSWGGAGSENTVFKYPSAFAGMMVVAFSPPGTNDLNYDVCVFQHIPIVGAGNRNDGTFNSYNWDRPDQYGFKNRIEACPNHTGTLDIIRISDSSDHGGWDEFYGRKSSQDWLVNQVKP